MLARATAIPAAAYVGLKLLERRGEVEVTLSWQARLLGLAHDLMPGATTELLALVNRALPAADGTTHAVPGMELSTPLSPSPLTTLMTRAAHDYNQYGAQTSPPRPRT